MILLFSILLILALLSIVFILTLPYKKVSLQWNGIATLLNPRAKHRFWLALGIIGILPILLYVWLRPLQALEKWFELQKEFSKLKTSVQTSSDPDMIILRIKEGIGKNPNDANGWFLLGRMYYLSEQYAESATAYQKAYQLSHHHEVLFHLLQAWFWGNGLKLSNEAKKYALEFLQEEPNHFAVVNMLAIDAFKNNYCHEAIYLWQKILNDPFRSLSEKTSIQEAIATCSKKLNDRVSNAMNISPTIVVQVKLAEELQGKADPSQKVYVFVKNVYNSLMPIAVITKQVSDLPCEIEISDKNAMVPEHLLSHAKEIVVYARISSKGSPLKEAGDNEGTSDVITLSQLHSKIPIAIQPNQELS